MAHYAVVINNVVQDIHVVANAVITDENGVEHEEWGQEFLAGLHGYEPEHLIQCSYNAKFRGIYPGVGFTYNSELDEFVAPVVEDAGDWVAVNV